MSARACRVCLVTGVKLHDVDSAMRQQLFALTELESQLSYICFECIALVHKCRRLREKTHRSQELLEKLARDVCVLTESEIQKIDRTKNNLRSTLTTTMIDLVEIDQNGYTIDNVPKPESDAIELEDSKIWILDIDNLKEETAEWEEGIDAMFTDLSDEEPLKSLVKQMEGKFRNKKTRLKKEKIKKESTKAKVRRKRKRPLPGEPIRRKTKKELEEFYGQFVTVVSMSQQEAYEEMSKRRSSVNFANACYKCQLCYRGFKHASTYTNHMTKHDTKLGEFECDFCHFRFNNRHSLLDHFRHFHNLRFSCKKCEYVCTNRNLARQHEAWHNGTLYSCKHCEANFSHYTTMQNHVRLKHATEFACELCGLCFVGLRGIRVHRLRAHRDQPNKTATEGQYCAECEVMFASQEAWKRHLVVSAKHNLNEGTNGCRTCGEVFPSSADLHLHRRQAHVRRRTQYDARSEGRVRYKPQDPNDACRKPRSKKIRPDMMCETCGKVFHTNFDFDTHRRKHTGEKPFKCKYCTKAFALKGILKGHLRTHTQEKPYPCSVCHKAFSERSNMLRHMQVHSEVKPVACDICEKEFKNTSSLKVHIKYVHLKKPYPVRKEKKERRKDPKMARLEGLTDGYDIIANERTELQWRV